MSKPKKRETTPIETPVSNRAAAWNTLKTSLGDSLSAEVPGEALEYIPWRKRLQTPSIGLNIAWGGGLRPGSIIEDYGPEGTMKTTRALQMCAAAQIQYPEKSVAVIDSESRVDLLRAATELDVQMEPFDDGTPRFEYFPKASDADPTLEDILNRIRIFAESGLFSLIVLDSLAACQTLVEAKSEDVTHTQQMGMPLRMSIAMRSIGSLCARSGTHLWITNQMRTTLTKGPGGMIAKKEPSGGLALRYAATHRLRTEWMEKEKNDSDADLHFLCEKIKYDAPDGVTLSVPVVKGFGIDREKDLIENGVLHKMIVRSGSWYSIAGQNIGQGINDAGDYLKKNPQIYRAIYETLMDKLFPIPVPQPATAPPSTTNTQAETAVP